MESIKVENIRQAKQFDELLLRYQERENAQPLESISMEALYKCLPKMKEPGRLYSFVLDLKIQFTLLNCDNCKMSDLEREYRGLRTPEEKFHNRTDLFRVNSNFILRYRAIWDKVMAIIVLILEPEKYDYFYKKNSRVGQFEKIFENHAILPPERLRHISTTIKDFNNKYRTAEAHNSGSSKTFSYVSVQSPFSDQANMGWAWNALLIVITEIGRLFSEFSNSCAE